MIMNEDDITYKVIYDYIEKSTRNRLVVERDGMIYCYNMQPPYDVIII
jgi:hypothetical protein